MTPTSGRHPLPCPAQLARTLGNWGISNATQVVAYDDAGGIIAARLWWLLRWLGHERCALLDGGLPAWLRRGLPLSKAIPEPQSAQFSERHDDSLWVDSAVVLDSIVNGHDLLLDARAAARYRGEIEPIDPVAGHVPNAINLPTEGNLTDESRFLPANTLKERFAQALGAKPPTTVIHMCGSGVTACHNLLAMEIAGLQGSRLYAGSWSEWIRHPDRPIATGGD